MGYKVIIAESPSVASNIAQSCELTTSLYL